MPQNPTEFAAFVTWGFYALMTLGGGILLRYAYRIARSIEKLNISMAVAVEKIETHKEAIDRHDERFERQEDRFSSIEREVAELRGRTPVPARRH